MPKRTVHESMGTENDSTAIKQSKIEAPEPHSAGDGLDRCYFFEKLSENASSLLEVESCNQSDDNHLMECISVNSIKTEVEDNYDTTDTLQMFCESVMSSSDYSVELVPHSRVNGTNTAVKPVPGKQQNRSVASVPAKQKTQPVPTPSKQLNRGGSSTPAKRKVPTASSSSQNYQASKLNVDTSKTNVTAIMLQSVMPPIGSKTGKNVAVGATAAANLLAQHHSHMQSKALGLPSNTTVLSHSKKSSKTHSESDQELSYSVCEDTAELKKLLVESNYNKHRLATQLTAEQKQSEKLIHKVEMLEAVVAELKQSLQSIDPAGYVRLTEGKLQNLYSELGL